LIGDPEKDAADFRANSPMYSADKIHQPLLMAHGGRDRRVPFQHSADFYAEVVKHNKQVEWAQYPEEGHYWLYEKDRYDFWRRVEAFLDKNLKSAP
jgi:dipeptidyl aminopeptidase/acylaminoacyl peptidase